MYKTTLFCQKEINNLELLHYCHHLISSSSRLLTSTTTSRNNSSMAQLGSCTKLEEFTLKCLSHYCFPENQPQKLDEYEFSVTSD